MPTTTRGRRIVGSPISDRQRPMPFFSTVRKLHRSGEKLAHSDESNRVDIEPLQGSACATGTTEFVTNDSKIRREGYSRAVDFAFDDRAPN
jgi:hypothetical protein